MSRLRPTAGCCWSSEETRTPGDLVSTERSSRSTSCREPCVALHPIGKTDRDDAWLNASFTDDGGALVVWSTDNRQAVRLDKTDSGRSTALTLADREATGLEFIALPDGTAQTWSDGAVSRYDASGRLAQALDVHRAPVGDVLELADGRSAATVGDAGEIELWNITQPGGTVTGWVSH